MQNKCPRWSVQPTFEFNIFSAIVTYKTRIFSKTLLIPDFEILWGEWTHIELKSWFNKSSGTFILHGGPLRPVVVDLVLGFPKG